MFELRKSQKNGLATGQFGVELFLFVLGLELDVNAFAAGPTARLSATVAIVLTVVLVIGTLTRFNPQMLQGKLEVCVLAVTGCLAFALVFGTSLSDAVIVGGCLALSSTPVAVGALTKEEHRQPHGELLLGFVGKPVSLVVQQSESKWRLCCMTGC